MEKNYLCNVGNLEYQTEFSNKYEKSINILIGIFKLNPKEYGKEVSGSKIMPFVFINQMPNSITCSINYQMPQGKSHLYF